MMGNNLLTEYMQLKQNPRAFFQRHNIPEQYLNSPDDAVQYLMNNGRVSQQQYNEANTKAKQLQNNPMFKQFFNR